MTNFAETLRTGPALFQSLQTGVEELSSRRDVTFVAYQKFVLPLDGYVFWIASGSFTAAGSLHYQSARQQREDETLAVNRVRFTAEQEVTAFNDVSPTLIYVGSSNGFRFAFSSRGDFYQQAGLYHYEGVSVYPALASQLVDNPTQLTAQTLVVSNSLPSWLSLASYAPIWLAPANPAVTLYPSFLVPDNTIPPYGTVHIEPGGTRALQSTPLLDANTNHTQLAADRVRITLYGLTNDQALAWQDTAIQYSRDTDNIGLMSMPVMRDGKRTQVEIDALAMLKTIDFEVSYIQSAQFSIARQLIEQAIATYYPEQTLFTTAGMMLGVSSFGAQPF